MKRKLTALLTLAALTWVMAPAGAGGAASNVAGRWSCVESAGGTCEFTITVNGGSLSGRGKGNGYTWPITGTVSGSSFTMKHGPYDQLKSYTANYKGTVAADNRSMSGTYNDGGSDTPFKYARLGAAPALPGAKLTAPPKAKTGPRVGIVIACGIDACIGEVDGVITVFPAGRPGDAQASAKSKRYKLKAVKAAVPAGKTKRVRLKVSRKRQRAVRKVLKGGGKARIKFSVKLTDSSGGVRRLKKTVKLTR